MIFSQVKKIVQHENSIFAICNPTMLQTIKSWIAMAAAVPQAGYAPERPAADTGGYLHQCNQFTCMTIRFSLPSIIKKEHRPSPLEKRQKSHQREMVRIWIAFLHHKKDSYQKLSFLFYMTISLWLQRRITGLEQHCNAAGGATCRNVYQEDCH